MRIEPDRPPVNPGGPIAVRTAPDPVRVFAQLVEACRRRDVKATIGLKRHLRELGYRVEPCQAREGVGR